MCFILSSLISALIFSRLISDFSISSMLPFFLSSLIFSSMDLFMSCSVLLDSDVEVVATAVEILTVLPSTNIIPLETLKEIMFLEKTKLDISLGFSNGTIAMMPGFRIVTNGIWFGNIVIIPLSVGIVICLILPSYMVLDGLEIFSNMEYLMCKVV